MSFLRLFSTKVGTNTVPTAGAHGTAHGHGHDTHLAPWEGVNLWRTPFKGDTDTVTQVKRTKSMMDRYVENRTRRIQQMQLAALVRKNNPFIINFS